MAKSSNCLETMDYCMAGQLNCTCD